MAKSQSLIHQVLVSYNRVKDDKPKQNEVVSQSLIHQVLVSYPREVLRYGMQIGSQSLIHQVLVSYLKNRVQCSRWKVAIPYSSGLSFLRNSNRGGNAEVSPVSQSLIHQVLVSYEDGGIKTKMIMA